MKKLLLVISFLISFSSFAEGNIIEFNLAQSPVIYQLNRSTGSLFGIIKDVPGGICLHKMELKNKSNSDNFFLYERNDSERGINYYQRFELNLLSNQVNIFTSARNKNSIIPIEKEIVHLIPVLILVIFPSALIKSILNLFTLHSLY